MSSVNKGKKVALISGGGGGFGSIISKAFLDDGYRIVLTDVSRTRLESVSDSLHQDTLTFQADLWKESEVGKLFHDTVEAAGRIDFLFIGHGVVTGRTLIQDTSMEEWNFVVQTNLTGTFLCMRSAMPIMMMNGGGCIISLTTGDAARKGRTPYVASKLGIEGLTAALSAEAREHNIGVYAVSPGGYAATKFHDNSHSLFGFKNHTPDEELRKHVKAVKPEVIVPFCRYAARDTSLSMSGKTVNALDWNEQHGLERSKWYA